MRLRWYHIAIFVFLLLVLALVSSMLPERERGLMLTESGKDAGDFLEKAIRENPYDRRVLDKIVDYYVSHNDPDKPETKEEK